MKLELRVLEDAKGAIRIRMGQADVWDTSCARNNTGHRTGEPSQARQTWEAITAPFRDDNLPHFDHYMARDGGASTRWQASPPSF